MSTSTNAILAWGLDLDEWEHEDDNFDPYEWEGVGGVKLIRHCSDECEMWILGVEVAVAYRGSPMVIDRDQLNMEMHQDDLDKACDELSVQREPGVLQLASWWC